jgi:GTPase KRas protein
MQKEYKITVLGSGGVGKSALTIRLITGTYEANYDPTIEDSYRKQVQIDGEPALLDILDTAGQEEYAALQDQWIREGDGFLIVFALNSTDTFEEAINLREKICRILDDEEIPIVLCGNKSDLPENEHRVTASKIANQAQAWKCAHILTSAKTKVNVQKAFFDVVREIRRSRPEEEDATPEKKSSFCNIL